MKTEEISKTYSLSEEENILKRKRTKLLSAIEKLKDLTAHNPEFQEKNISDTISFLEKKVSSSEHGY